MILTAGGYDVCALERYYEPIWDCAPTIYLKMGVNFSLCPLLSSAVFSAIPHYLIMDHYIFSGSLPEEASTYVTREADRDLYEGLTAGKFCYVLNSRQSGKSSLRVRTMRRLRENGVECAAIDLSAGGIQNVPPEQWYADLIDTLIESFGLDVDFFEWWETNQLNSLVTRFRKFLEEILLVEVQENIVIFIDEIDSVLSLNFPTDDFFAFIRSCYNQRVDNPLYNRLTFCLLGVASPSNLIEDKQRTPFNIGKAITLKGFQPHEVEPLEKGLWGKYSDPQAVVKEILQWTGGQPFLTQKLCQFMVEESEQENPRTVEQVVRSRIIENWESQDEPEHLRTIRARILRDEQRAPYRLELYQQIRLTEEQSEMTADETLEQSELQLSGLVVRQQNKLRVYNPIYKEIFDQNWIETQLRNLRPYAENFRFWVASSGTDKSRLLRGKALQDALEWAKDKSLNYQDREFLAASQAQEREEEMAVREKEAQLERERKDKEAVEKRNLVLAEANKKAQRRILIGSILLIGTLSLTGILGIRATQLKNEVEERHDYVKAVEDLARKAGQLQDEGSYEVAEELFSQAGQSARIPNHTLRQVVLNTGISYAYMKLRRQNAEEGHKNLEKAEKFLEKISINSNDDSPIGLQIRILYSKAQGNLFKEQKKSHDAVNAYKKSFQDLKTIQKYKVEKVAISPPFNDKIDVKILSSKNVEALHREFIDLLSKNKGDAQLKKEVEQSLKEHYYDELKNLLAHERWQQADTTTTYLMLYVAGRDKEGYFDEESINRLSCPDLRRINDLWVEKSKGHFGFSVQKEIYTQTGNTKKYDEKAFRSFVERVGWYTINESSQNGAFYTIGDWVSYSDLTFDISAPKGHLPTPTDKDFDMINDLFSSRTATCQL